mmetsp:Transcript_27844/g.52975  ORF Transcript_27844/g.52975 Transcript_27844/m.52975 type:complete len:214 (+) Transcript_27844:1040-1681(+)
MRHSQPVSVPGQQEHHRRVPPRRRAHEGGASVASLPGQQTSSVLEKRLSRGDVPFRAGSVQRRQVGLHRRVRDAGRRGQASEHVLGRARSQHHPVSGQGRLILTVDSPRRSNGARTTVRMRARRVRNIVQGLNRTRHVSAEPGVAASRTSALTDGISISALGEIGGSQVIQRTNLLLGGQPRTSARIPSLRRICFPVCANFEICYALPLRLHC